MAVSVPNRALPGHRWFRRTAVLGSVASASAPSVWIKGKMMRKGSLRSENCAPLQAQQSISQSQQEPGETMEEEEEEEEEFGIMCEPCKGRGWLLCDFCKGKKTNVKAENNRIYRRCPTCRTAGYVLCSKCKVYKCVSFPDYSDGEL